jgi:Icc-related predicted phosphoesterase
MPLFRKSAGGAPKRLFFVTDLHGSTKAWGKMLSAASVYRADALICGGDVAGKRLYPIVDRGGGRYAAELNGRVTELDGEDGVFDAQKRIEDVGGYHKVMGPDEAAALEQDSEAMEKVFVQCVRDRLVKWISVAEERLNGTDVKCYITGGNDDEEEMLAPLFEESFEHIVPSENAVVDVLGHQMISLGWSNETPWATPRETTEDRLAEMIEASVSKLDDIPNAIFNLHVPPKDSTLDTCPKLDTSQLPPVPVMSAGQVVTFGAGSSAVDDAIKRYQPLLSLHGHIHESTAARKIGRTTCINPGSEYHDGALLGTIVALTPDKIVKHQFTRG